MTIVETRYGKVRGLAGDGLHVFKGIPFAAPPVGRLRWAAPKPPQPWVGVRDAQDWGPQAWQPVMPAAGPLAFAFNARAANNRQEDCLQLNVWTPGIGDQGRPVFVWIHGGGFSGGTGATPMYDGAALARRGDVVVVTLNYRLGALGFLRLEEITGGRIPATGNEGLLDMVCALEWVRENIASFGGDPDNVTIAGESAGGMSVGALLAFEPARGLFRRAIPQSGAASTAHDRARAAEIAAGVLAAAGHSPNDDVDELLAIEPEALVNAAAAFAINDGGMIFQPCIDGTHLSDLPLARIEAGVADPIDVLVGATADEWRLFNAMNPRQGTLDESTVLAMLSRRLDDPETLFAGYRQARAARGASTDPESVFAAIETDRVFRIPGIRLAEALAKRGRTPWQYLFDWISPWQGGVLGSPHAIDIGFVFATHAMSEGSAEFFGSGGRADALAAAVQDAWIGFIRDGSPAGGALDGWRPYDRERRSTGLFGDPCRVEEAPLDAERALWDGVAGVGVL